MKRPEDASRLIQACIGLHNLCKRFGDEGEDFPGEDEEEDDPDQAQPEEGEAAGRPTRRDELLRAFE